ncbi:DUF3108 domain-containing protein [Ottowia sp. GY511]|uniref:DUF3108 domain-containing protein n=1 Tax=Ottowia flava TaxID=2675430 RepID=A0ABW4KZ05_9BURK|nr:DUF3108 domain-containing protein [Ottowia sp. GY511]TXK27267.1 DUF3108 domain-containing protein [Ottowia sp. GY511]
MPRFANTRPSSPWLRLVAVVVLAHAAVLTALSSPPRTNAPSSTLYWSTRSVAQPPAQAHEAAAQAAAEPAVARPAALAQRATRARANPASTRRAATPHRLARPADGALAAPGRSVSAAPRPTTTQSVAAAAGTDAPVDEPATAAPAAGATELPRVQVAQAATLTYAVTGTARGQPVDTRSELRWQPAGGHYEAEWRTLADGPRPAHRWHSQGLVTSVGLMPERFAERTRAERAAHFDAAGGRVRFSANTPDAPWSPGGQDRLSAVLQLGALLAAAPERYPPGSRLSLQITGARDAAVREWTVQVDEVLTVDGQPVPCAVLMHQPERPYEPAVTLWLARPWHYLPARLRQTFAQADTVEHSLQNLALQP